jgi:hypothetical protein
MSLSAPRRSAVTTAVASLVLLLTLTTLTGCVPSSSSVSASSTGAPGGIKATPHKSDVPAPGGGSIDQTVAPVDPGAETKVAIDQPAALPNKVTIVIVSAVSQTVKANTPGEIAGPAVVVKVRITNGTAATIDLGSTVVTLLDAAGNPGQATTAGPASPFTGTAAPGKSLEATYVFGVPATGTIPVQISVSYAGGAPVALFTGNAS